MKNNVNPTEPKRNAMRVYVIVAALSIFLVSTMASTFLFGMGLLIGDPVLVSNAFIIGFICAVPASVLYLFLTGGIF